jgi:hypothetical protein
VARGIEEGDNALVGFYVVGADMLGYAAGFTGGHARLANVVEQRGLAVIDVTHDGDHGRTGHLVFAFLFGAGLQLFFEIGGIVVQNLVDGRHGAHLHQGLDYVAGLDRHALGQIGYRYGFGNLDVANYRSGRFFKLVLPGNFVHLALAFFELLLAIRLMRRFLDMQLLTPVAGMFVLVLAMLAGLFRRSCGGTGCGSLFQRGLRGGFGRLGSFLLSALLFDCLLRSLDFLQAPFISLLFRLGARGLLGSRLLGLGRGLSRFLGPAGLFFSLLLLLLDFLGRGGLGFLLLLDLFRFDVGATHVGAFLTHLYVNRLGSRVAPRCARHPELASALSRQRYFLRPARLFLAMAAAQ